MNREGGASLPGFIRNEANFQLLTAVPQKRKGLENECGRPNTGLMKRIYYASGSVLTGDRMADAVVSYASALAARELSDTVDIPISLADGELARAQLLIGPASQLVVVPEPTAPDGPEDDATIDELSKRRLLLSSPHPQASDEPVSPYYAEGNDYSDALDDGLD